MKSDRNRFDETELDELRQRNPLSDVLTRFGVRLKKSGRNWIGLSPFNPEKTPSFTVDDRRGFYHCFSSGQHGDVFDAVMHFKAYSFVDAVKFLGGTKEVTPEDRARLAQVRQKQDDEDRREREQAISRSERAFADARAIEGTHAAAYLNARGLVVAPSWTFDLRFSPKLPYHGFKSIDADEKELLGEYPAMVAAIRDVDGVIVGLHRTYLAPDKAAKLNPPGDAARNRAKKILGNQTGGMIRLSRPGPRLALGEGIETTRSWYLLGLGGDDIAIASAISIGNLAGGATGSLPHPTKPKATVPNGIPDVSRPGVRLPHDALEVVLIGDGDSDPAMTRARMLVAGKRFEREERDVFISMAPTGKDFNDVLMERGVA